MRETTIKNNNIIGKVLLAAIFLATFPMAIRNTGLSLLLLVYIGGKIYYQDFSISKNSLNKYIIIFFLFSIFSLLKAVDLNRSLDFLFSPIFRYAGFYFIAFDLINLKEIEKYIYIIFTSKLVMIIYGFLLENIWDGRFFRGSNARSAFGGFLVLFALTLLFTGDNKIYHKVIYVLAIILGIMGLTTQSRGAVVGFLVGFGIWSILILYKKFSWRKFVTLIIIIILLLIPIMRSERLMEDFRNLQDYRTDIETRTNMWTVSIDLIRNNPILGVGIGNFKPVAFEHGKDMLGEQPWGERHQHPHNLYLHIAVEQGIISLMIFFIIIFISYKISIKNYLMSKIDDWSFFTAVTFISMSSALLTQSFVSFVTKRSYNGIILLVLLILNFKFLASREFETPEGEN